MSPICSVCIANYNGMGYIEACINSVLAQDFQLPVEIIVHDDASTDDSVAFIREHYPDVKLIRSKENVGFCVSNNRMADQARGEYLLLLNNDAELFPDALSALYSEAKKEPAIIGPSQYNAATGERIDVGNLFDVFLNTVPNNNTDRMHVGMVSGGCLWLPTQLWDELGGFPDWFHTLGEDIYLCCVARLKGYPVKALKQTGFYHWVGTSIGGGKVVNERLSTSINRRALSERNRSYVMALTYPTPIFHLFFPLHLISLIIEGMAIAMVKMDPAPFRLIYLSTIRSLWRNRSFLRSMRHRMQKSSSIRTGRFFQPFTWMPYKLSMLIKYGMPVLKG